MSISKPQPNDAEAINEVVKKAWYATYVNEVAGITKADIDQMYAENEVGQIEMFRKRAANSGSTSSPQATDDISLVAKRPFDGLMASGEEVVGFIRVKIKPDAAELLSLYILPEFAGQGIGTKLWQAMQEYLPKDKPVFVEVVSYTKAVDFYTKLGFVKVGESFSEPMLASGNRMPQIKMVLSR